MFPCSHCWSWVTGNRSPVRQLTMRALGLPHLPSHFLLRVSDVSFGHRVRWQLLIINVASTEWCNQWKEDLKEQPAIQNEGPHLFHVDRNLLLLHIHSFDHVCKSMADSVWDQNREFMSDTFFYCLLLATICLKPHSDGLFPRTLNRTKPTKGGEVTDWNLNRVVREIYWKMMSIKMNHHHSLK